MIKLAKREEQIMQAFWELKKAFIRDIVAHLPDPKPHYNSVGTIIKVLEDKGFLARKLVGNIYCYYPTVKKEEYQKHTMKDIVSTYFDNSYSQMLAFFAKDQNLSIDELSEIFEMIKKEKS
ncbi:MAG: BlaI/MecI/CopY family transcriptional regulator [Chitinophagaceae bacterium]|nr:MAG: BlaI/MecI/CopY family transcriptional regulator [Chitinophagaceae bacterium]